MPRRYSRSEIDRFLRGRHVCILGTIGPDGASVLTPIWYLYRDGQILMRTSRDSVKARNISRDARVSVCIQYERPPYASVTAYGKASLEPAHDKLAVAIAPTTCRRRRRRLPAHCPAGRRTRRGGHARDHAGAVPDAGLLAGDAVVREDVADAKARPSPLAVN